VPVPLPLETKRLVIRAFDPAADTDEMVAVYCDPEVMRFIPGGALADEPAVRKALERYAAEHRERGFGSWAVVERDSGRVIGDAGFGLYDPPDVIELGYTIGRAHWGRGYGVEAASACLAAGREHLRPARIVALVDARNEASLGVPQRIGMARVGTVEAHGRPHVLFSSPAPSEGPPR
jgi:ribosomal-protein-alanine N-acetyltransferase